MQQMQEQMNSTDDCGDVQVCGIKLKWKDVSRFQSTCNGSEFSRLAQQRQKIAAWHMESVWITRKIGNHFSTFDSPRDHPQRIQSDNVKETEKQFLKQKGRRLVTQAKDRQNQGTIPVPTFATRQKDSNYRNCNSTYSLIHNRSLVENSSQKSSHYLFWLFHRMPCCESKKWWWLILWTSRNPRDPFLERIYPNFEMLDAKIASALNDIIQNSQVKKKVSLERHNTQKEDRFLRRHIAFMIYDYFSSDWCSWHSITLCWFILCYSSWWQHSRIRYKMGRSSVVDVKNSIRRNLGKSV